MSIGTYGRAALAGLYRSARVGLVTPLRDGMNLVAKEYIAAQDPENPGVLILSRFAGAAAECVGALLVNPYDPNPSPARSRTLWKCLSLSARNVTLLRFRASGRTEAMFGAKISSTLFA